MSLQAEIDTHRKEIRTDSYPMSFGELVNLYKDGELDLHPEFQRVYRWSLTQKSRWIESILLGIPLPSIFVVQREDGVWDVIDGLQRMSSVLEFMGELKDENQKKLPSLILEPTKYLPSLGGKSWKGGASKSLTLDQQRYIKRAKITINIIQRSSNEQAKYELFQRLNTGGSQLSNQEVRSCIIISVNREVYRWISELAANESFQRCIALADRQRNEQYDLELVVRFLVLSRVEAGGLVGVRELGEFLTDEVSNLAKSSTEKARQRMGTVFSETFENLDKALEGDSFRKYDRERDRFVGGFSIAAFEVIALGIGFHGGQVAKTGEQLARMVKGKVWSKPDFLTSTGITASQRLQNTLAFGRKVFAK